MGNKEKDREQTSEGALGDNTQSPQDAWHANRDLSQEKEARDATLAKQVVKAIAREMAKAHTLPGLTQWEKCSCNANYP